MNTPNIPPLAPLLPWLDDPSVSEILVDSYQKVYFEQEGQFKDIHPSPFNSEDELIQMIQALTAGVGRVADESHPLVDFRLPGSILVNVALPPISLTGVTMTIRKNMGGSLTLEDLLQFETWNLDIVDFLRYCVLGRLNILFSGGTGSGKTTVLNLICGLIPDDERIITIERADELVIKKPRVVRLETRPPNLEGRGEITAQELVRNALRMRPDRIILGEAHGAEVLDMLQAINSGHDGAVLSIHANSPLDALARLEVMAGFGNPSAPLTLLREQIASAIDVIVYQERLGDGSRKILKISEVTGVIDSVITTQDIFEFRRTGKKDARVQGFFTATGTIPRFLSHLREYGIEMPISLFTPK